MTKKTAVASLILIFFLANFSLNNFTQSYLVSFTAERTASTDVLPVVRVVPGGHSIGVVVKEQGVSVVGHAGIETKNGIKQYPGKQAGLEIGDIIMKVNGIVVESDVQIADIISANGKKPLNLTVKRGNKNLKLRVTPILDSNYNTYRIGIYIRDSAAGVGTLTFFNPEDYSYGALGHAITDKRWQKSLKTGQGRIIQAVIQGIYEASRGAPGEKIGLFVEKEANITGDIQRNSKYGIFGFLDQKLCNEYYTEPIPIAPTTDIRPGKAEILTVLEGDKIERFSINIEKVFSRERPDGRAMIIKITDSRLLSRTGGIIQGMSGSPIIQDDKLIGAVTHVFVNDPTRGYGVAAEWMVNETVEIDKAS